MIALTERVRGGNDLSALDVQEAVAFLLSDSIEAKTKADFLTALHEKGESASEIASFVRVLLERAVPLEIEGNAGPIIDVCGTGGDGIDLFNVSTAITFILAAGGATVVKHGNRRVTSQSGSADVLEALGIAIDLEPEDLRECIKRLGCGFVYARTYHPAFRALAEMRLRLARKNQRTIFNLLGPLLNPARPKRQLVGVFAPHLTRLFAEVLSQLDCERAWIVSGTAVDTLTLDDVSTIGPTSVAELNAGKITSAVLDTRWLGIPQATLPELVGGDARANAETIMRILAGAETGPKRDLVIVNAAAGFVVAGLANEMNAGIAMAREEIDSGRALEKLKALEDFRL
ncbi:MAG TPA: anthranilate phosphoribosyltransferase [Chthoniobacterales bacterium]|nr:anthranilate phosphoribosyltransferase [Chthoniobacterales bacterium]